VLSNWDRRSAVRLGPGAQRLARGQLTCAGPANLPGLASQSQRLRSSGLNDLLGAWRDSLSAGPGGGRTPLCPLDPEAAERRFVRWTRRRPNAGHPRGRRDLVTDHFRAPGTRTSGPATAAAPGWSVLRPYREALSPNEAETPKNGVQRYIAAQPSIQTTKTLPAHLQNHPAAGNAPSRRRRRSPHTSRTTRPPTTLHPDARNASDRQPCTGLHRAARPRPDTTTKRARQPSPAEFRRRQS
jgi:hypothetical protein